MEKKKKTNNIPYAKHLVLASKQASAYRNPMDYLQVWSIVKDFI